VGNAGLGVEPGHKVATAIFVLAYADARFTREALIIFTGPNEAEVGRVVAGKLKLMRRGKAGERGAFALQRDRPVTNF
jgi:hypothetical protein